MRRRRPFIHADRRAMLVAVVEDDVEFRDAIIRGDLAAVECMLCDGANPNAHFGEDGWVALFYAIEHDWPQIVAALLAAGADVNYRSEIGCTALHCAIESEVQVAMYEYDYGAGASPIDFRHIGPLLIAGADTTAFGSWYKTPVEHARGYMYLKWDEGPRRRARLAGRVTRAFTADDTSRALDVLELVDFAWRHNDSSRPPGAVIDQMLADSHGDYSQLIVASVAAIRTRHSESEGS